MGVAANLRFHPIETAAYRTLERVPMSLVGLGVGVVLSGWDWLFEPTTAILLDMLDEHVRTLQGHGGTLSGRRGQ